MNHNQHVNFVLDLISIKPMSTRNAMSRQFIQPKYGKLCVQIEWRDGKQSVESALTNLDTNLVVSAKKQASFNSNLEQIWVEHLDSGNYQLTLRNLKTPILHIKLCPGKPKH
jgi:hypothetical protein